jgi:REP element-mobilizing transposase RayT
VVFGEAADYERFLEQLDHALDEDRVVLYAYVLMPNHYHLFVETPRGNLTRFMQRLNTAYGMYFRHKKQRPGHCFQGRYGARAVEGDEYLVRLTRYIHLNPVKVKRCGQMTLDEKRRTVDIEEVERAVMDAYGIGRETLYSRQRRAGEAKGVALELCCRLTDTTQRALAVRFGYSHETSVGKQRQRVVARLSTDKAFRHRFDRLAADLKRV